MILNVTQKTRGYIPYKMIEPQLKFQQYYFPKLMIENKNVSPHDYH